MTTTAPKRKFWTAYALGGITVLAAALLGQGIAPPRTAVAQIPDSGLQRKEMVDELKAINAKLTDVVSMLREIRDVEVAGKGQQADKPPAPTPKKP